MSKPTQQEALFALQLIYKDGEAIYEAVPELDKLLEFQHGIVVLDRNKEDDDPQFYGERFESVTVKYKDHLFKSYEYNSSYGRYEWDTWAPVIATTKIVYNYV